MNMTAKQENEILRRMVVGIFWMARRYAHGRSTYAPGIIREWYQVAKNLGIPLLKDETIEPPKPDVVGRGMRFREDFLDDCNETICPPPANPVE